MTTASTTPKRAPTKAPPAPAIPGGALPAPQQSAGVSYDAAGIQAKHVQGFGAHAAAELDTPKLSVGMSAVRLPIVAVPRAKFMFLWSAMAWQIGGNKRRRLVPALRQMRLQGGLSNVIVGRDGTIDVNSAARGNWEARGWRALPFELGPDGTYVRRIMVDPQGEGRMERPHYATAWEQFYSGTAGTRTDEDGYCDWLEELVRLGHIAPCPLPVAAKLRDQVLRRVEHLEQMIGKGVQSKKPDLDHARSDLAILDEYLTSLDAPTEIPINAPPAASDAVTGDDLLGGGDE